jgi:3-oxoadipate enol-lactonase
MLLHAGVADRRVWDGVAPALAAAGYRAIRYDVRGFGRSPVPTAPHSLVADALAVLDAAGVPSAHFVGLSQGAATSIDVALAQPGRVRSLSLIAPSVSGWEWPALPGVARRIAAAEADDTHGLAVEIARLWAPMSFQDSTTGVPCDIAAQIILDQAEQFMRDELETEEPSAVDRLGELRMPTLIVLGGNDLAAVTAIGAHLAAGIEGARSVSLADADHMLPLRVPAELTAALLAHLSATPSPV